MGTGPAVDIRNRLFAAAPDTAVQHRRGNAGIDGKCGKGQTVVRGKVTSAHVDDHRACTEIAVVAVGRTVVGCPIVVRRRGGQHPCAVAESDRTAPGVARCCIGDQIKGARGDLCGHFIVQIKHGVLSFR